MKEYEIITREASNIPRFRWGGKFIFLTKAKNIKSALRRLLNNSGDFRRILDKNSKELKIIVKELKE